MKQETSCNKGWEITLNEEDELAIEEIPIYSGKKPDNLSSDVGKMECDVIIIAGIVYVVGYDKNEEKYPKSKIFIMKIDGTKFVGILKGEESMIKEIAFKYLIKRQVC